MVFTKNTHGALTAVCWRVTTSAEAHCSLGYSLHGEIGLPEESNMQPISCAEEQQGEQRGALKPI